MMRRAGLDPNSTRPILNVINTLIVRRTLKAWFASGGFLAPVGGEELKLYGTKLILKPPRLANHYQSSTVA